MHDAHDRGPEQPVVEAVPGDQLGDDGVLVDVVGLLGGDRFVDRRVESLADRRDRDHAEALECGFELADDKLQAAHEEFLRARLTRVLDSATQVVEHGQQCKRRVLALVAPQVGELLGLASLEVLEVRGQAEVAGVPLVELLGARRRRAGWPPPGRCPRCRARPSSCAHYAHGQLKARPTARPTRCAT